MRPAELVPSLDDGDGEEPHAFSGYLHACGEHFAFHLEPGATLRLHISRRLHQLLSGQEAAVVRRLTRMHDVASCTMDLCSLVEQQLIADPPLALPPVAFYEQLISELDAVGWDKLAHLSSALDEVELVVHDERQRPHTLALHLPPAYPAEQPRPRVALPSPFELRWGAGDSPSLSGAIRQFETALSQYQELWDALDDIDEHTWVLEPKAPTRECTERRIALGSHCSLQIGLHAWAPATLPQLQFLGAERPLASMKRALNANLHRWDTSRAVRLNLEDVLEVALPTREHANADDADDYSVECAICYNYQLDEAVPECACDGCSKPFHQSCLGEWLRGLPTTQQSFNRLFGECPYCGHAITATATT